MSNEIDEKDEMYDSASIEVKEGFFSKLFSSFGRKALPPANGVVKTNASMSSLMARGSIRAALINIGNKIQNVISPKKEVEPKNTLSAHIVGENSKNENSIDRLKSDDETVLSAEQPKVFIPTNKTSTRRASVMNNTPAKSLSVEEINVDSDAISKETELEIDNTTSISENEKEQPITQNLQAVEITIDNKEPKSKDEKTTTEHEQSR